MGKPPSGKSKNIMEINGKVIDFRSIIKEVQLLGSSDMTWKERKDLQNKKVVSLGGKATKQQRLPLSVARLQMKNHKIREQKRLHQELLCGRSGESMVKTSSSSSSSKQRPERRKLEDSVLKSSQGVFRNGVLDVKHLLKTTPTARDEDHGPPPVSKGKTKQKGGNKNHGKKKGGGKQRH
ncbi:uncharacterized protein LOC141657768 isoform X2 [Silene latifolia]|uniref:uncharacterized protein LOC141657768 isoform X1 n=1 Tax=Silene latifolia TaxID=37657 RepID=UPI003D78014D